ncbi:P-loop NTPase fold protein [Pendulispora albinea]|uniref:KAP family NTPase n=1 Tax=Pendulispora albinea TaxID=2741071 RepID=A0ABZ2LU14_9BACT
MLESVVVVAPRMAKRDDFARLGKLTDCPLVLVALPDGQENTDASAREGHLASGIEKCETARFIVLVQGNPATDADGHHRAFLTQLYARLSPKARRRSLSFDWQWTAPTGSSDGLLPSSPPWGRSAGDLANARDDDLRPLLEAGAPPPRTTDERPFEGMVMGDHPATDDRLGFEPAVGELASILSSEKLQLPLVVSIEGGWGAGKSSFMAQLRTELRKKATTNGKPLDTDPPGVVTIWFDAWAAEAQSSLLSRFVLGLLDEIQRREGLLTRGWNRLRLARRRFDLGTGWKDLAKLVTGLLVLSMGIAGAWASIAMRDASSWVAEKTAAGANALTIFSAAFGTVVGAVGIRRISKWAGSPFSIDLSKHLREPGYEAKTGFLDAFRRDLHRVIDVYAPSSTRIYVFIDDLDRCDPALVAELTQAINVLLGQAVPFVYVLGLDRQKVAAAIAAKYDKIAALVADPAEKGAPLAFGHAFLEKLIQLPYRVPAPTADALPSLVASDEHGSDTSLGAAVRLVARFLEFNPRRIKQFTNVLSLRVRLLAKMTSELRAGSRRPTLHALAKVIAIELRQPELIRDIAEDANLLNALVLGSGRGTETEAYRRWSAQSELMELLTATLPARAPDVVKVDREVSLLDVDFGSLLHLSPQSGAARDAPEVAMAPLVAVENYAREYERLRRAGPSSVSRTKMLTRLFDDVARIQRTTPLPPETIEELFSTEKEGNRIAALALCQSKQPPLSWTIALRVLDSPRSAFEDYQALRLLVQVWPLLDSPTRRRTARAVSHRRYTGPPIPRPDTSRWVMSETLLRMARSIELEDEIMIELPDQEPIRIELYRVRSFNALADRIYAALDGAVAPYSYGTDWVIRHGTNVLEHMRQINGEDPGEYVSDERSLRSLGVGAGDVLRVELLGHRAKRSIARSADDASRMVSPSFDP